MVARDFDQYLFFYEFLNAFTGIIGKKIDRERVKQKMLTSKYSREKISK